MAVEGRSKGETESEIIPAHQALQTKYHGTKILQTETDSKCRLCQQFDEKVEHITSSCPVPAKEQYIKRLDTVCAELLFNICKVIGVKLNNEHWYDNLPKSVETGHKSKVTMELSSANQQNCS